MSQYVCLSQWKCRGTPHLLGLSGFLLLGVVLGASVVHADSLRRLIEFAPGTPIAVQQEIVAASGSTLLKRLPLVNAAAIKLPSAHAQGALDYLRSQPEVQQIHLDPQVSTQGEADTEGVESQLMTPAAPPGAGLPWNLLQIALDKVNPTVQGQGVEVAVVDTGIDPTHPALTGKVLGGYNAVTTAAMEVAASGEGGDGEGGDGEGGDGEGGDGSATHYMDCNGHGTHVAGIIAAQTVGIAPQAKLHAVRVLDCQGGGFVSDLISGLSWVYEHPQIRVVNLSLGFYKTSPYPLLHQAITALNKAGVVLVAAAGNYRSDCLVETNGKKQFAINALGCNTRVKFPARYPEVIAVAATDADTTMAYYSIRGPEMDITAPGGSRQYPVVSTITGGLPHAASEVASGEGGDGEGGDGEGGDGIGAYGGSSGTSMATAHVTGVVALLLSVRPSLRPAEVQALLQDTATRAAGLSASAQGRGRMHAAAAVAAAPQWKSKKAKKSHTDVDDEAYINESVVLGNRVQVEEDVVIEAASQVMDNAEVKEGASVEMNSTLGMSTLTEEQATIGTNVAVGHYTVIGERSYVGAFGEDVFGTTIGDDVLIEQYVVIGTNVRIGDRTTIKKHTFIGDRTTIGDNTLVEKAVFVGEDVVIGNKVVIQDKAVVCDGAVIPDNAVIVSRARVGSCF